ncbi:hypothetical protein LTR35_014529 [Friedmanniomyces endolithicus]|uniref:AA1-like domain-containing protein n=1 Tax=Friedmanniomyces endolithicus TaxID=329885 RepID=A0AAN6J9Q9_9PEZI|nr:hypothetical protein LTR35_014529 [Friedmanniomyces endolithicus]KAK0273353.1 hypothetical protein LTS00_015835 [Friedmanniomyces endolithicus]KAK0316064.1 hypothetical protein LTR82_012357 [Friedmanniomyces endolithicus]KAK0985598.1 hypothetical protein LTR54_013675 [Friedmanniomyces endolithicus]
MHLFLTATLLALSTSTSALPTSPSSPLQPQTKRCTPLLENTPWTISNLVAFQAATPNSTFTSQSNTSSTPPTASSSYITFHFCDTNPGLELETTCTRLIPSGSGAPASVTDPWTYYPCDSDEVRFIYSGASLTLERSFVDDCLGAPPYNSAIVGGSAGTTLVNTTDAMGNTFSQQSLVVSITEEW